MERIRVSLVLSFLVVAVTAVFVALVLVIGRATIETLPEVNVGDLAPQDYIAPRFISVTDKQATQQARDRVSENVPVIYSIDALATTNAKTTVREFFQAIRDVAFLPAVEMTPSTQSPIPIPPTTETPPTTEMSETTTADEAPEDSTEDPTEETVVEPEGEVEAEVEVEATTTVAETTAAEPTTTTLAPPRRSVSLQIALVEAEFILLESVIPAFVEFYNADLDAREDGGAMIFADVEAQVLDIIDIQLVSGIRDTELDVRRTELVLNPPEVFFSDLAGIDAGEFKTAAAFVAAQALRVNEHPDEAATQEAREAATASVEDIVEEYVESQPIANQGDVISAVQFEALLEADLLGVEDQSPSRFAVAALGSLIVLLAAFFLWRLAPREWSEPKHFMLLGVLLVLAAVTCRLPEVFLEIHPQFDYAIPVILFGYIAAILYDPRTAVIMAVPLAAFTAVATADPGLTVYAGVATVVPVAFVSSVVSRRALRVAVMSSVIMLAPLAAVIAWLFEPRDLGIAGISWAVGWAVIGGVVGGLTATGLLPFLEARFKMTTTVTLLDLVDRNHPALRLIEERAPGTFNHSVLVGTLAGKAARSIGADPLLAQAAAFYHDLGKTEHPQFYIENQFGVSNPHDELPAVESAQIIRGHVVDGLRLARRYRIPDDVADGIRMHHGTGLIRYFYHKALSEDPAVDPDLFRHGGEKPRRKEMAILMICDACEGAARAVAQREDPTEDSIKQLVESVVGEKLEDGQLDESDLTYGELTRVKHAVVEALIGYYHPRIPYPGFPGPKVEQT